MCAINTVYKLYIFFSLASLIFGGGIFFTNYFIGEKIVWNIQYMFTKTLRMKSIM